MKLLYSNILPLGVEENQETVCECFGDEAASSDAVEIAVGYISKASLEELDRIVAENHIKENYGIDVPLDFNYYPRGQWDSQDAVINGWRIDVKGTRKGGHWMLIEWNKLNFRQRDNNLSHLYAMFSVDWDRSTDSPTGFASYEGAVSLQKLRRGCQTTRAFRKGEMLPGTHTVLQADNYGIQFRDLYKHLNHLVAYLTEQKPPESLTENFQNPYTGQTTAQILEMTKLDNAVLNVNEIENGGKTGFVAQMVSWFKELMEEL